MDHDFWHQRWRENQIGFHQDSVNAQLMAYWSRLDVPADATVFVPLCGKSLDMVWLAERYSVLGVELSPKAVEDFFKEQELQPARHTDWPFMVCSAKGVNLYCGDFFALQPGHTAAISAIYDRAALIALPPSLRQRYAEQLTLLTPSGTPMLLVTLAYDQSEMDGPPFSVEAGEVEALFGADWTIEALHQESILAKEPRFQARGLRRLSEQLFKLVRR